MALLRPSFPPVVDCQLYPDRTRQGFQARGHEGFSSLQVGLVEPQNLAGNHQRPRLALRGSTRLTFCGQRLYATSVACPALSPPVLARRADQHQSS